MNIKITKQHLEDMKKKLDERMYRIQKTFRAESEYNMFCWEESEYRNNISANYVVCELDRTYRLCDEIDWYIDNLKDDGIEVDSNDWFVEWRIGSAVNDSQFDRYYMFPYSTGRKQKLMKNDAMKFNKMIKIYRTDVEKIKSKLKEILANIYYNYHIKQNWVGYYETFKHKNVYWRNMTLRETQAEIYATNILCNKADVLLCDDSFDFIWVDADEWFNEWNLEECIESGLIDKYYMFPDSDEVDEIFEKMKDEYQYAVTDLFGIYRFYVVDDKTVIA